MIRTALIVAIAFVAAPAVAQTAFEEPRFEGLEMQNRLNEQNRLDRVEKQRQDNLFKQANPTTGTTAADAAIRNLELREQSNRILLEGQLDRQRQQREADIRDIQVENRRIARSSTLRISEPSAYALAPAPRGQYYARLNGRFVLVDETSELVVKVLDRTISDPVNDAPTPVQPAPLPAIPVDRLHRADATDAPAQAKAPAKPSKR